MAWGKALNLISGKWAVYLTGQGIWQPSAAKPSHQINGPFT